VGLGLQVVEAGLRGAPTAHACAVGCEDSPVFRYNPLGSQCLCTQDSASADINDGRWQISTGGGTRPAWNRNGRELVYVTLNGTLMSVPVETGSTFSSEIASRLIDFSQIVLDLGRFYDVSPDGKRFLIAKGDAEQGGAQIRVILNWFEELKRLVPVN
jgi:hypothetical protein